MDLGISTNPTPEIYTIKVTGEIDISNADSLRNAIDLALEQPTEAVELDFAQVSYIDSTGIGVLVGAAHHAVDHGKRFSCTNVQPGDARGSAVGCRPGDFDHRCIIFVPKGRAVWHMFVMRSDVLASGRYT
ncbi:MAG: STAS domain-containing protein [Collinsella sp.]